MVAQGKTFAQTRKKDDADNPMVNNFIIYDDFPAIHITKFDNPAPGNIYLDNFKFSNNDSGAYLIVLDNAGNIIYAKSLWGRFAQDFKPQPNGMYTYFDAGALTFKFFGLDSNFNLTDSFEAANGYTTDSHELIFLPDGGYALLAQTDSNADLSKLFSSGKPNSTVETGILQAFDAKKKLVFEWRTQDHFALTDATYPDVASGTFDFTHCNAIVYDPTDSTFLLSSRNLDEITKISRKDGHIIWRWGGSHNEFKFVNDSLIFSRQHAVRKLANGNILLFDNGTFHHTAQPFSRAVEYSLDEQAKVATKVWEYHHDPDVYGNAMGYVQQLANGNRLICWGGCDSVAVTEVTPEGKTAFELKFDPGIYSYRAYKFTDAEIKAMQFKSGVSPRQAIPFSLDQNYPNPFGISTVINFNIVDRSPVDLIVYDAVGRQIRTLFHGTADVGSYSAKFDGTGLPSGTYFYKLNTNSGSLTKILTLLH
jgi:hypothetical protein